MILDDILKDNHPELQARKLKVSQVQIENLAKQQSRPKDFAQALRGLDTRIIAEIKRASPSKGVIKADIDAPKLARTYAENGAAAISVLTDSKHFGGSLDDLRAVRDALEKRGIDRPPLLRKDFLWDGYQIYEAKAFGADAVLLIVAVLLPEILHELVWLTHKIGLKCLVEVHNEKEVKIALKSGAKIIGINNRDLNDFSVNINTTRQLLPLIPKGYTVVSESGIRNREDIEMLKGWGANAVLIGESLVTADDPGKKLKELL